MPALSIVPRAARAATALACTLAMIQGSVQAQTATSPTITRSTLDAQLFYQLLIGELELRAGQAGTAYQVLLDAARKTGDEDLFRRATEIALQSRAGDQAIAAIQAWRQAMPSSLNALRYQVQLLIAMNRQIEAMEPMRSMLRLAPVEERIGMIASLPRLFARSTNPQQSAKLLEQALQASVDAPETRVTAQVALGRAWLATGDTARALELAQRAQAQDPGAEGPALLALELLATTPAAEPLITGHLKVKPQSTPIRLVYARVLSAIQRYADAIPLLEEITRLEPQLGAPWLTLGALHLELKAAREATAVLSQYVQRVQDGRITAAPINVTPAGGEEEGQEVEVAPADQGLIQAYLLLSQAAELQRDFASAESWLAKVSSPQRALEVESRRASLLVRQGKVQEGRELIRRLPEKSPDDARAKLLAEAQLLRDSKQWADSNSVLSTANQKFPDDVDLLYEQSMMVEKLNRMDEMERLLRRVIALKPDHHHAYNALGYSLAERNQRLPEARALIRKALELAPGEPFITDSLGWVEYRMGNREEALRLLQQAYQSRPDVEIAAHLAEVLWVMNKRDEARRILREARERDAANDVLTETIARLRVDL